MMFQNNRMFPTIITTPNFVYLKKYNFCIRKSQNLYSIVFIQVNLYKIKLMNVPESWNLETRDTFLYRLR